MERFIKYANIFVDRRGTSRDAFMRTVEIIGEVEPKKKYVLTPITLTETNREVKKCCERGDPERVEIIGHWDHIESTPESDSNILGGLGKFKLSRSKIRIPIAETTDENLAFYNARLLAVGDTIEFDTPCSLPVTIMQIGDDYVDDYIMTYAGGVYLEIHDRPHFHMPTQSRPITGRPRSDTSLKGRPRSDTSNGHLILGRQEGKYQYVLSAFKIPYGYGIYTSPYVIHNDCFLRGEYQVVYSVTSKYSTVRVLDRSGLPVKFEIGNDETSSLTDS